MELSGTVVDPELAEGDHTRLFYAKGCICPAFNGMNVTNTLAKFVDQFLPKCPVIDPRGKSILILKSNFPKLTDLAHITLSREVFSASKIVESIEAGTFNLCDYHPQEQDRMQTLFWIPDVLADPDAIYRNGHNVVAGDEIYVKVFDKPKPQVKMVFTMDKPAGKKIKTVPVTSFLTSTNRAIRMIKGPPLYLKK